METGVPILVNSISAIDSEALARWRQDALGHAALAPGPPFIVPDARSWDPDVCGYCIRGSPVQLQAAAIFAATRAVHRGHDGTISMPRRHLWRRTGAAQAKMPVVSD